MSEQEKVSEPSEFFYICRKCGRSIPARFPDNIDSAKMVEVKKHNYEFECRKDCEF